MDALATQGKHKIFAAGLIGLFALNLYFYGPLFSAQQRPYKGSISAGYAGITRFVAEHPNPWGWNPQQYAGQPTQFTYPPLLPYTASALHWVTGLDPFHAYRIVVSIAACLGPIALAFAFYYFTGSTWLALLLGLAYTICSPVYGLFERIDQDRGLYYLPWRLLMLMKYGEGPHVTGMTFLPLILVALRWGSARRDWPSLVLMALAFAVAPLTNWLLAFGLAITVLVLMLSDWRSSPRLIGSALLGYGLSVFWLTPEYVQTTLFNWPKDAYGYQVDQSHWPLYCGLFGTIAVLHLVLSYYQTPWVLRFTTIGMATFLWIAGGFYLYGVDTIPESRRYVLEFEQFLFLAIFGWLWYALRSKESVDKFCAALVVVMLLGASAGQISQSFKRTWSTWGIVERDQTLEYQVARWLNERHPSGRIFASGGLRFRLNAWFPLHQVSGTFESGLRNRIGPDYFYQVVTDADSKPGEEALDALRELTAIGAEYAIVHTQGSEDYYRDIKSPEKFNALGSVVFSPTPYDHVYRLPFRSLAHLVAPDELPKSKYKIDLPAYYAALTDTARPQLHVEELSPSHWRIGGTFEPGKAVAFSMNWDPGWTAKQGNEPIALKASALGMILAEPRPGRTEAIELIYEGTAQQRIFTAISACVWIVSIGLCIRSRSWQGSTSMPSS